MGCWKYFTLVATAAILYAGSPTGASGAEPACGVRDDPAERADCEVRAQARAAARAEVDRRVAGAGGGLATAGADAVGDPDRPAAWERAIEEASGVHLDELGGPRPIAFVVGLVWLAYLLRRSALRAWSRMRDSRVFGSTRRRA